MLDERIQGVITFLHKICPFPPKPFPPREQQRWHTDLYYEDIKYLEYFHLYFGRLKDISLPRSYFSGLTGQICLDSTNDVPHSKFSNDEGEGVHIASSWITIILSLVIIFISNLQRIWSYLTNCMTTSCAKHIIRGYDSLSPPPTYPTLQSKCPTSASTRSSNHITSHLRHYRRKYFLPLLFLLASPPLTSSAPHMHDHKHHSNSKIVTCVGDSITKGSGASSPDKTYPALLERLLQDHYKPLTHHLSSTHLSTHPINVINFGVSSMCATKKSDHPYWKTEEIKGALKSQPSIVLIMFGTNDAKAVNWNETAYISDYKEMVY